MTRLLLPFVLLFGCGGTKLPVAKISVGETPLTVEVANTPERRRVGLMKRDSLPEDRGMIFVYDDSQIRRFWMKDTRIPLSIAFLDDDGIIKRIADMEPFVTDRTSSLYPVQYAIEVNKGWFGRHGVEVGDAVTGLDAVPGATTDPE